MCQVYAALCLLNKISLIRQLYSLFSHTSFLAAPVAPFICSMDSNC